MVTVSCIKADIGGWVGHSSSHPDIIRDARGQLEKVRQETRLGEWLEATAAVAGTAGFLYLGTTNGGEPAALAATVAVGLAYTPTAGRLLTRQFRRLLSKSEVLTGEEVLRAMGCDRLYPNRRVAMPHIVDAALAQGGRKVGSVLAAGVSLRDFLHRRYELSDGSWFADRWADLLNQSDRQVYCDLAILYHGCREAQRRADYEKGVETIREMDTSERSYRFLFDENPRVRCGLSRLRPSMFAFVTDDLAFVQRYLSAPPPGWRGGCYGGLLPVERYRAGTMGYEFVKGELLDLNKDEAVRWI